MLRRFDGGLLRDRVAARRGSLGAVGGLQIGQLPTKRLWRQKVGTHPQSRPTAPGARQAGSSERPSRAWYSWFSRRSPRTWATM